MDHPSRQKKNTQLLGILGIFFVFVIIALLYRSYMNSLFSDAGTVPDILVEHATQFTYQLLTVFLIFILLFYLYSYMLHFSRLRLQEQLRQTAARYSTAFEVLAGTIWEYDITADTLLQSDTASSLFPNQPKIPNFRSYICESDCVNPEDHEKILNLFDAILSHSTDPVTAQFRANNPDGEESWFEISAHKIFDSHGIPISLIGQTINITHLHKKEVLQHELEGQDKLTKLNNAHSARSVIEHYLESINYSVISAIFLIDLDNFSKLSSTLGSSFADAILLDLSAKLKKYFQPHDIIARVGHDSFLVFLTDSPSISYIEECAEGLCMILHDIYSGSNNSLSVTGSIGVSVFPSAGNTYDILCEKAAIALHAAKNTGKDCFFIYSEDLAPEEGVSYMNDFFDEDITSANAISPENHSLINTSIVMNSIDILFGTQENTNDSIQMLLSLIGTYYNLDRISILEYSENPPVFSVTYEWTSHADYQLKDILQRVPFSQDGYYAQYRKNENGVFYSNSFLIDYHEDMILDPMPDRKPRGYFQCGFSDHGKYIGYISATVSNESHLWSQDEIDSLTLISKIIGSCIIRMRSIHYANWLTKADQLTGAYNFNSFLSEVNKLHTEKPELSLAIIYSDIKQFKLINDNYGYQTGDSILKSVADIYRMLFPSGILCRISGDKFVLCARYSDEEALANKARMLVSKCRQLSSPEGEPYHLSLLLGIYPLTEKDTAISAVDRANIARKNAQHHENSGYAFFTNTMRSSLILQKDLETAMENSLLENDFLLYFQPKYDINTQTICGAEALVRWQHPTLGFLYPNAFIPLFESNGFIINLDYYMFEQVCMFLRDQIKLGKKMYPISVNFSREHFKADGLPEKLKAAVEFYNVPPELIEIEITESAFATIDNYFISLLLRIRSYGFRLSMDDFGSGLSSLNLLCDLPFNVIKIDKDFFHSKTTTTREHIVISNIVRMAYELDMDIICEGVETVEQTDFLKSIGCNMAQGYLFSKPISKQEFIEKYFL